MRLEILVDGYNVIKRNEPFRSAHSRNLSHARELLIKQLQPPPDPSRSPIFQVSYIYLDFPELAAMNQVGLRATGLNPDNGSSRFDLTLALTEKSAGLDTLFEYNTDLFEAATVRRMLAHLVAMLEAIANDADCRIAELP